MTLQPGSRLGPYEVTAPIGAGGMGEVWRARDTRLDRNVALKLLPADFAADADRVARFTREAKVLASLNHAGIAAVHGFERIDGQSVLSMELVDGEGLDERIALGPLPLDEALGIARQMAEALEAAHEKGVVHRDLKPANVKLTQDGRVKLLDFGLAKALQGDPAERSGPELTQSPTLTARATQAGVILGTAAYMSPEQARGKPVDKRADIWAFGVVLWEMLTGKRLFAGETVSDTLAAVLRQDVDLGALPASTPSNVRDMLRRCLVRDPKQRLHDIGDARLELEESGAFPSAAAVAPPRAAWIPWAVAALAVLVAVAVATLAIPRSPAPPRQILRSSVTLPPGLSLDAPNRFLALSQDGTKLALAGSDRGGRPRLWVRPLDELAAQPVTGTEGASYPFWSPDGRSLGFFADGKLKRVALGGGTAQTLCEAQDGRGASWGAAGTIVFSPNPYGGLFRVAASGGTPVPVTTTDSKEATHRNPHFLPDGRRVLFLSGSTFEKSDLRVVDLAAGKVSVVAKEHSEAVYVEPGFLLFVRGQSLMAQRVSPGDLALEGDAVPVAESVHFIRGRWTGGFAASANGLLVYEGGSLAPQARLAWFDLEGHEIGAACPAVGLLNMDLASDGTAFLTVAEGAHSSIHACDTASGTTRRLTYDGNGVDPIASPDGKTVYFGDENGQILAKDSSGLSAARPILAGEVMNRVPSSITPDGGTLVLQVQQRASWDIALLKTSGGGTLTPLVSSPANETRPRVSPDGRWLAYLSDESEMNELYLMPFPSLAGKLQVSSGGADTPQWLSATELAFWQGYKLFSVSISNQREKLAVSSPRPLLGGKSIQTLSWAVVPGAKKLLLAVPAGDGTSPPLTLVTNWTSALAR